MPGESIVVFQDDVAEPEATIYEATYDDSASGEIGTWLIRNAQPRVHTVPVGTTSRRPCEGTL